MSKRSRGTRRNPHQRAARRPPLNRSGRPMSPLEAAQVAAEDIERGDYAAAAHELERVDREPVPAAARTSSAARPGSYLAARAASEYVYVGQDLRHIAVVAALLFGIMGVLFVLLEVVHVIRF